MGMESAGFPLGEGQACPTTLFDVQRLRVVVARMRIVASEEELVELMSMIDSDNDGAISFGEFFEFVTHQGLEDENSLVGRLRRALRDNSSKRAASEAAAERSPLPYCQEALKTEFEELSRVQHEARILDGGARRASSYDAKDWLRVLASWPSSFIIRRVMSPLCWISAWALVVAVGHRLGSDVWSVVLTHVLVASAPGAGVTKTLTLAGAALSLLLVFRTNTAYERYAEGRLVWETLCSAARDSAEFCGVYMHEMGEKRVRRVADLLCAFPIALQLHLQGKSVAPEPLEHVERSLFQIVNASFQPKQGGHAWRTHTDDGESAVPLDLFVAECRADDHLAATFSLPSEVDARVALQQLHQLKFGRPREKDRPVSLRELQAYYNPLEIARILPTDVRARLARSRCAPLEIARILMREAKAIPYDAEKFTSRERLALMNTIARLRACVGSAERIVQTPVPLHYARHALRFLSLWCILLPLALVEQLGFLVVPVTAFMVWALYGLREIGTLIENPFTRPLQLKIISEMLFIDVREAVDYAARYESNGQVPPQPPTVDDRELPPPQSSPPDSSTPPAASSTANDFLSVRPYRVGRHSTSSADYLAGLGKSPAAQPQF